MKKLFIAIFAIFIVLVLASDEASSQVQPTIAVIDTGIDMTHPVLQNKITQEVCIMDFKLCPNGNSFMEGTGAATLDPIKSVNNGFYHGTQMSSVIINNNPNAKIVFIRIVGMNSNGSRASTSINAIAKAMDWIVANQSKYNISVVSMSMSTSCVKNTTIEKDISKLQSINVPSIFPTGNGYDYTKIDFPACIPQSVAVGALDQDYGKGMFPALYSNNSIDTDFYALGTMKVAGPNGTYVNGVGTSISSALLASKWLLLKNNYSQYSQQEIYNKFISYSRTVSTKKVSNVIAIDMAQVK